MKIAVGGMNKNEMSDAIKKFDPEIETVITTDIDAASMLKKGEADYYFGACHSGGGSAISVLIGLVGYSNCCTACKTSSRPNPVDIAKYVNEGKFVFGMTVDGLQETVPIILENLRNKEKGE